MRDRQEKIDSFLKAMDYKLMCEARDILNGNNYFKDSWERILMALESYNAQEITMERLQEIIKGYYMATEEMWAKDVREVNYAIYHAESNLEKMTDENKMLMELLEKSVKNEIRGSESLKQDYWFDYVKTYNLTTY